jgi:hypothetical protein
MRASPDASVTAANLALWTVAVAVAATGPGRFSLDATLGWADNLSGLRWGVGVLAASLATGGLVLVSREQRPEAEATEAPLAREREEKTSPVQS